MFLNVKKLFPYALEICKIINKYGFEVRIIGGAVRDALLNKIIYDVDLATTATPEQIQDILSAHNIKYYTIGKEFGTINAIFKKQQIEITTLRKDVRCDGRYAEVAFSHDWAEDAKRRDFTINALSVDVTGKIYDYCAGIEDIYKHRVRFIGDPESRILEDYLRILRFFRFSASFAQELDQRALSAIRNNANKLKELSISRFSAEMIKILSTPSSTKIIEVMYRYSVLECNKQNIDSLKNLDQFSQEFNYIPEIVVRLFILMYSNNIYIELTRNEKKLFKLFAVKIEDWDIKALKKYWCEYKLRFKDIVLINLSLFDCKDYLLTSSLNKLFSYVEKDLPVTGSDLLKLGVEPGPLIGKILKVADQIWYDHEFQITKGQLLKEILLYVKNI
jgi:poly(A) polymerase